MVLLSAGIGATPVLAMLHALAEARSTAQVLWLHSARDRQHHPFSAEVRRLMLALKHGRSYVCYSRPGSYDRIGEDFDAAGHLSQSSLEKVGVPREADIYICGPTRFMAAHESGPRKLGRGAGADSCRNLRRREPMTPGIVHAAARLPHPPQDDTNTGPLVSFARSGTAAHWNALAYQSILELAGGVRCPGPLGVSGRCLSQL